MAEPHVVNYADLSVLSAFYFLEPSVADEVARMYDPGSEADVKAMLRRYIMPRLAAIEKRWPGTRERLKESLRYFLTKGAFPVEEVYYAQEPVVDLPANPLDSYRWAWDVLWPDEVWHLASVNGYVERNTRP